MFPEIPAPPGTIVGAKPGTSFHSLSKVLESRLLSRPCGADDGEPKYFDIVGLINEVNSARLPVEGAKALSVGVSAPSNIWSGICGNSLQSQNGIAKFGSPLNSRIVCSKYPT